MYLIEGFTPWRRRGQTARRTPTFRSSSLEAARAEADRIFREHGIVVAITKIR